MSYEIASIKECINFESNLLIVKTKATALRFDLTIKYCFAYINARLIYLWRESSHISRSKKSILLYRHILPLRLNPSRRAMNARVYRYTIETKLASALLENWVNSCANTMWPLISLPLHLAALPFSSSSLHSRFFWSYRLH